VLWADIDSGNCMDGYNLFDFFIWLSLLLLTVGSAIITSCTCLIAICCAPCIYRFVTEYVSQMRAGQVQRNGVIDAIVLRKYNPNDFKQYSECVICMAEFTEEDEVTPLPCN